MRQESAQDANPFIGSLESLRGIAALMVAVAHSMMILKIGGEDRIWARSIDAIGPLEAKIAKLVLVFASGGAAVTVFFVLSGVVLGLSLDHAKREGVRKYLAFVLRRVFRIYPAYILSILFILFFLFQGLVNWSGVPEGTAFFNWPYRHVPGAAEIIANFTLLDTTLNPIGWTLTTEMAAALIFPFLYMVSRRGNIYAVLGTLLVLMVPTILPGHASMIVLPQLYKFFVGLLLPRFGKRLLGLVFGDRPAHWGWFAAAILLLLAERQLIPVTQAGFGLIETAGAAMIVMGLLGNSGHAGSHILEWHLVRRLGRQSYSFYLWHFPFLYVIAWGALTGLPAGFLQQNGLAVSLGLCAASVVAAFGASYLSYRFVEAPAIHAGKHLAARLFGKA